MRFPLDFKVLGSTSNLMSFQNIDLTSEVEIPVGQHVGAFGHQRRHDTHTGIDLYCPDGTPVKAMGDGKVIFVKPFTGQIIDLPWWEDTWSVCVLHDFGYVIYGEIYEPTLKEGDVVKEGDILSTVKRVLKKNKGRPQSMLHLELHTIENVFWGEWKLGTNVPAGLLDPSDLLMRSAGLVQCIECLNYYTDEEMASSNDNDRICQYCDYEFNQKAEIDMMYRNMEREYLEEINGDYIDPE